MFKCQGLEKEKKKFKKHTYSKDSGSDLESSYQEPKKYVFPLCYNSTLGTAS